MSLMVCQAWGLDFCACGIMCAAISPKIGAATARPLTKTGMRCLMKVIARPLIWSCDHWSPQIAWRRNSAVAREARVSGLRMSHVVLAKHELESSETTQTRGTLLDLPRSMLLARFVGAAGPWVKIYQFFRPWNLAAYARAAPWIKGLRTSSNASILITLRPQEGCGHGCGLLLYEEWLASTWCPDPRTVFMIRCSKFSNAGSGSRSFFKCRRLTVLAFAS